MAFAAAMRDASSAVNNSSAYSSDRPALAAAAAGTPPPSDAYKKRLTPLSAHSKPHTNISSFKATDVKTVNIPIKEYDDEPEESNLVALGTVNKLTGEFTSRFVVIQCKPTVEWLDAHVKHPSPHQFQIRISLEPPFHDQFYDLYTVYDSDLSDNNVTNSDKVEKGCMILIPRVVPANAWIQIELYSTRFNSNGQLCQYEVGTTVNLTVGDLIAGMNRKTRKQLALEQMTIKTDYFNKGVASADRDAIERKQLQTKLRKLVSTLENLNTGADEDEDDVGQHQRGSVKSSSAASLSAAAAADEQTKTEADVKFHIPQPTQAVRCAVVNVMGEPQAIVSLRALKCVSKDPTIHVLPRDKALDMLIQYPRDFGSHQITGGLRPSSVVSEMFRRTHINVGTGSRMPVWIWCMTKEPHRFIEPIPDAYLTHAIEHTTKWFDFNTVAEWSMGKYKTEENGFEILGQVLGFVDWQTPYLFDKTFDYVNRKMKMYDEFSLPRVKPCGPLRSGDCEDFSKQMQQVFCAILRRRDAASALSPALRALVDLASGYCCFIVDASIKSGGGARSRTNNPLEDSPNDVSLHMYTLLIPWNKVAKLLSNGGVPQSIIKRLGKNDEIDRTEGWPTLSLESTEISVSNWRLKRPSFDYFGSGMSLMVNRNADNMKTFKKVKVHTTGAYYASEGFYRVDICGYSIELYERSGIHSVLFARRHRPTDSWTYGVPKEECMRELNGKCQNLAFQIVGVADTAAERALITETEAHFNAIEPLNVSEPFVTNATVQYSVVPNVVRIFSREFDWSDADDVRFRKAVESRGGFTLLGDKQVVPLYDHVRIVMYEMIPKEDGDTSNEEEKKSVGKIFSSTSLGSGKVTSKTITVRPYQPFTIELVHNGSTGSSQEVKFSSTIERMQCKMQSVTNTSVGAPMKEHCIFVAESDGEIKVYWTNDRFSNTPELETVYHVRVVRVKK